METQAFLFPKNLNHFLGISLHCTILMERIRQIRYFFFSQSLADGVRITLEIIIPAVVFSFLGHLEIGMTLSLGALCVSISDGPGPVVHKRNGMLYCNIFIFIMAIITGLVNDNVLLMGIVILLASFLFTMISVYGNRAASIGTASLLMMILRMTTKLSPPEVISESLLVLAGGVWYMIVALLFYRISPYRPAQRSLGYCIHETAKYLLIKSEMYNLHSDLENEYKKLLDQQVIVNEKQNDVRELLFKNRELLKESTYTGRLLVLTFVDVVDLFEHIMATWYDYSLLRKKYASTGILEEVSVIIKHLAQEMDNMGEAIQSNGTYKKQFELIPPLETLKEKIDSQSDNGSSIMLKKILVNLRNLGEKVEGILKYFDGNITTKGTIRSKKEYSRFVTHQKINGTVLRNNLTLESSTFRYSLRMMITCGIGFGIAKLFSGGHHSYWIIMTIIIILKPGFSLTRQKNFDRLIGTICGGIAGVLILAFIYNTNLLFALMVFFMVGTYTFVRSNYIVMVIFLTPYILILFHFLGLGTANVAIERLIDTAIASLLAFLASYFLFPNWESTQLQGYMAGVLKANIQYLQKLKEFLFGNKISSLDYKLVRKGLFVSTANLSAALHRMLSEPKSKQLHRKEIYEFVVLNHVLSSNIASLTDTMEANNLPFSKQVIKPVNNSLTVLEKGLQQLDKTYVDDEKEMDTSILVGDYKQPDETLEEQLNFIHKVSEDIGKVIKVIST
ncbi:MAG: FUSC family protein [Bacteroidota bacterium]|nr:FUSC family protein [Bacteroidota bacterium]